MALRANTSAARRVPRTICVLVYSQHGVEVLAAARGRHEARNAPAGSAPHASAPRSAQPLQRWARCAQLRSRGRRAPAARAHRRGVRRAAAYSWRTALRRRPRGRGQRPRRLHGSATQQAARKPRRRAACCHAAYWQQICCATRVPFPARTRGGAARGGGMGAAGAAARWFTLEFAVYYLARRCRRCVQCFAGVSRRRCSACRSSRVPMCSCTP